MNALIAAVVLFAIGACTSSAGVASRPASRLSLQPQPGVSREESTRLAMMSIHAFVEKYRKRAPLAVILERVDPISPVAAARILALDESVGGRLRKRRALLRLLTWVRDVPGVQEAVRILTGVSAAESIYRALESRVADAVCDGSDDAAIVNDVLDEELAPVAYGACSRVDKPAGTVVDSNDGRNIIVLSSAEATGSLDRARSGLDPQSWEKCSPLWARGYMVALDSAGNVKDNGKCSGSYMKDCMPEKGADRPAGESYDTDLPPPARPFFENFRCDQLPCDLRLMLRIESINAPASGGVYPSPTYQLTYSRPTQWKDFLVPTVDQGSVRVDATDVTGGGQRLSVSATKLFGFDNWAVDAAIRFVLEQIELGDYLVELACCDK